MDTRTAIFHTVHDYGVEAMAQRLGKGLSTMYAEVSLSPPRQESPAKMGVLDLEKAMDIAKDLRPLYAMNARFGHVAIPLPQLDESVHADTMAQVARLAKEFGDVMTEIGKGAADNKITDHELQALQQQWGELVAAGTVLLATWTAKNQAGKPASERGAA